MSEGSQGRREPESFMRRLTDEEKALVVAMVRGLPSENKILQTIEQIVVEEMQDGGMGSLHFVRLTSTKPRFGKQVREATFVDEDGVPVSITINLDQDDQLFELDVFKADNSRLKRFPRASEVHLR